MGFWPFTLKRTIATRRAIQGIPEPVVYLLLPWFTNSPTAPYEDVQKVLKDAPTLIRLNPLVTSYETKPDDPTTYIIVDNLKTFFGTFKSTYTARVEFGLPDDAEGQDSGSRTTFHVKAGGGMTSINHWTARRVPDRPDESEVVEESHVEVRLWFPLSFSSLLMCICMWYRC